MRERLSSRSSWRRLPALRIRDILTKRGPLRIIHNNGRRIWEDIVRQPLCSIASAARPLLLAIALLASGCGGGGGGGATGGGGGGAAPPPEIEVSTTSLSTSAKVIGLRPDAARIQVTIASTANNPFGIGGTYTINGIGFVTIESQSSTGAVLRVDYQPPTGLTPGVHRDAIAIGFCVDAACQSTGTANRRTISVTYTVIAAGAGETPSVALSMHTVSVTGIVGDIVRPPTVTVNLAVSNPPAYSIDAKLNSTYNGLENVVYVVPGGSSGQIQLSFKLPEDLAPGVYTDTVAVTACLDMSCVNPVALDSSNIAVQYTITDTVVGPQGFTVKLVSMQATDVAWDAARNQLYLAAPANALSSDSTITTYDPNSGTTGLSVTTSGSPSTLAISDDSQFLYVGYSDVGDFKRYTLAPMALDIDVPLGSDSQWAGTPPYVAYRMQVAPGQPHTIAVLRSNTQLSPTGRGITIFDDAVQRPSVIGADSTPNLESLQWGADAAHLYATAPAFAAMSVDANGPTAIATDINYGYSPIHFYNDMLYTDHGEVLDAATGQTVASFALAGYSTTATLDTVAGRMYFLTSNNPYGYLQLEVFDLNTRDSIALVQLPTYNGFGLPRHVIRWGGDGLAIVSDQNNLMLIHGPVVAP